MSLHKFKPICTCFATNYERQNGRADEMLEQQRWQVEKLRGLNQSVSNTVLRFDANRKENENDRKKKQVQQKLSHNNSFTSSNQRTAQQMEAECAETNVTRTQNHLRFR